MFVRSCQLAADKKLFKSLAYARETELIAYRRRDRVSSRGFAMRADENDRSHMLNAWENGYLYQVQEPPRRRYLMRKLLSVVLRQSQTKLHLDMLMEDAQ